MGGAEWGYDTNASLSRRTSKSPFLSYERGSGVGQSPRPFPA